MRFIRVNYLEGGGNNSSEVKEWYYEFDAPQFAKDNDLNLHGSSEAHQEEMQILNGILLFISPAYKIVSNETGSLYINYETNNAITLFDLRYKIPCKFNESYYSQMPVADDGDKGITLIFKGTVEERFQQIDKLGELNGSVPSISKYFKSITKEEYYSYLEAKEMDIYEFLEYVSNQ